MSILSPLTQPWSGEAEQATLGAVLLRASTLDDLADLLTPEDFYRSGHGQVFQAMLDLWRRGEPVDLVTVTILLKQRGQLEGVGGPGFLAGLSEHVGTAANATYYARIVREKAMLRELLQAATGISQGIYTINQQVGQTAQEYLAQAEERIWSIREQRSPSQAHKLEDLAPVEVQRLERIYETRSAVLGIPSGFADLDALTAGWQPGDLILLAARPSMGKTACALNMAFHAAQKGTPTLFISLEQPKEQLTQRQIAASGGVNAWRLRSGKLRVDDWPMVIEGAAQTYGIPLWIVDAPAMTLLDIRSQARRLKRKEGAGLILVDYLQLIKDPRARSREQEVGNISRGLKALAKELCIPVIALAQLNREVEKRPNKRPQLSDLRESGSLEQDADLVIFLYRDEVYNENSPDKGLAEVNIAKQRNGPTGWIKLVYRKEVMQFADYQEGNFK